MVRQYRRCPDGCAEIHETLIWYSRTRRLPGAGIKSAVKFGKKGQPDQLPSDRFAKENLPAIAPASAAAIAAAATVIAPLHRLGLVDGQSAAVEIRIIERGDGILRFAA